MSPDPAPPGEQDPPAATSGQRPTLPLPGGIPSPDEILDDFLTYCAAAGLELYDHQENAILELFSGKNVILNTPTGSGKSLVALALQYRALRLGRRCFYTVPIKALANEKFLSLCHLLGPDQVGMITGDATVNPAAPLICCTAEILAIHALREGGQARIHDVVIDEFHYYADRSRGTAWQIPLLTLPQARFLLMSATLGDASTFESTLTRLTGAPTATVRSDQRPVPLEFEYSEVHLTHTVANLVARDRAPIYIVHFSQLSCAETAGALMSTDLLSREEKQTLAATLATADFRSPYGRELSKYLRHGIGIHHAGLLPKYRVLVEKLAQRGLLKVICGTDTLGVGVNVPIRTGLFTRLCKFDGESSRILPVRDFQQIAGRAGRRGFDTLGTVVCQAPEHVIENLRLAEKAAASPNRKSYVKRKPPAKGYVHWDETTFRRLAASPPERLESRFEVSHAMILHVLGRQHEDGCYALRSLLRSCHESPTRKRDLQRRARKLFRSLVEGGILRILPPAQRPGSSKIIIDRELPADFSLTHALGLYLLDTLPKLDPSHPLHTLQSLSVIEARLENPDANLNRQADARKAELLREWKDEGVPYEERIERLQEITWPQPGREFLYATYNEYTATRPWLRETSVRPKSVAREMFENWMSFEDAVKTYGIERSEAVLLRHLAETWHVLARTVPDHLKTPGLQEAEEYLEAIVRHTDTSLIEEWNNLRNPSAHPTPGSSAPPSPPPRPRALSQDRPALLRALRRAIFDFLKPFAHGRHEAALAAILPHDAAENPWSVPRLSALLDATTDLCGPLRLDPEARANRHTHLHPVSERLWRIEQSLLDEHGVSNAALRFHADLDAIDASGQVTLRLDGLIEDISALRAD